MGGAGRRGGVHDVDESVECDGRMGRLAGERGLGAGIRWQDPARGGAGRSVVGAAESLF